MQNYKELVLDFCLKFEGFLTGCKNRESSICPNYLSPIKWFLACGVHRLLRI